MHSVRPGALHRWLSRSLSTALVTGVSLLAFAGAAQADVGTTITQTAITSPSDPAFFYDPTGGGFDSVTGNDAGFTVTGTTDSTDPANDQVDIYCDVDNGTAVTDENLVLPGVSLDANGSFTTIIPYWEMEEDYNPDPCRLRAVPAGVDPSTVDLSDYTGPRVLLAYLDTDYEYNYRQAVWDYYLFAPQLGSADDYWAAGDCGLTDSELYDPTVFGQSDGTSFGCNDYTNADNDRGNIGVDGQQAYLPWDTAGAEAPGQGGLTVSATQNPTDGDMTIDEVDPIALCSDDTNPCDADYVSSGVEDQRTITQTDSGHIVYIDDRYTSTDGQAHTVTLDLENTESFNDAVSRSDLDFEFPGQSASTYSSSSPGVTAATAPASIFVWDAGFQDGSPDGVRGAITYFTTPSGPFTFDSGEDFTTPYTLMVPAGGSVSLDFAYSTEFSQAAVQQDVETALDMHSAPKVAITSPAAGTKLTGGSVTVGGTASAGSGVKSVTVNGVSATLSGSSFSAVVPLTAGSDTLTATVTSDAGGTATASTTVTVGSAYSVTVTQTPPRGLGLTVKPKRDTAAPYRFGYSGKLKLPSGVNASDGCNGTVTLRFKHGKKIVLVRYARVNSSCRYSGRASFSKAKLPKPGKLSVSARFGGNSVLKPRAAKSVSVAYGAGKKKKKKKQGSSARAAGELSKVEVGR